MTPLLPSLENHKTPTISSNISPQKPTKLSDTCSTIEMAIAPANWRPVFTGAVVYLFQYPSWDGGEPYVDRIAEVIKQYASSKYDITLNIEPAWIKELGEDYADPEAPWSKDWNSASQYEYALESFWDDAWGDYYPM
jgi:hypothetical protein